MSRSAGVNKGGRPRGVEKVDITLSLTKEVWEWIDDKMKANEFSSKSWFVDKILAAEMARPQYLGGVPLYPFGSVSLDVHPHPTLDHADTASGVDDPPVQLVAVPALKSA